VRLDDVAEGLRILGEAGIDARVDDGLIRSDSHRPTPRA
jgi:hypothetical protein